MTSPPQSFQALPSALPDLNFTFGAAVIGMVVATLLFGVCSLQTYTYYQSYPEDWIIYRVSVAILWTLDGLNVALVVHFLYHYLIICFGDYAALNVMIWSFKLQTATNTIVVVIVQALYSLRVWKFNYRKSLLPVLIPFIVAACAGTGVALVVETYKTDLFSDITQAQWSIYASHSLTVVVDFAIAGTLCYYLNNSRSDYVATNSMISTLMFWILGTGFATSICSLAALVMYAVMPGTSVFLAFEFLLSKLYVNSLLAMLNNRKRMSDGLIEASYSISLSSRRTPHELNTSGSELPKFVTQDKSPGFTEV